MVKGAKSLRMIADMDWGLRDRQASMQPGYPLLKHSVMVEDGLEIFPLRVEEQDSSLINDRKAFV